MPGKIRQNNKLWSKNEAKTFKSRQIRAKTDEENIFLEAMFRRDPSWGRRTVQICKRHLNLKTTQIYKWGFDKKKLIKKYKENPVTLEIEGDIQEMIDRLLRDEDIGDFVFENSKYIIVGKKKPDQTTPNVDYNKQVEDL